MYNIMYTFQNLYNVYILRILFDNYYIILLMYFLCITGKYLTILQDEIYLQNNNSKLQQISSIILLFIIIIIIIN